MHYDVAGIRSEILSARSNYSLLSGLSDEFWAKTPGGKRVMVHRSGKLLAQHEIRFSCDFYAAQASADQANPAGDVLGYEKAMARLAEIRALAHELHLGPTHRNYRALWRAIVARLDAGQPKWREISEGIGQLPAVRAREAGRQFRDDEILEAFVKGALSGIGGTWGSTVEPALPDLRSIFHGFDLRWMASLPNTDSVLFQLNRVGLTGPWLASRLRQLLEAARVLMHRTERLGSLDNYLTALLDECEGSTIQLAVALGTGTTHKLPAFGLPTAAEALKNCGFDLAKPDIHVNRALGSLCIAGFCHWQGSSDFVAPEPTKEELIDVMRKMEEIANCVGVETVLVDNAIWLLCSAKENGGLHLTNDQIEQIGTGT